MKLLDQEMGVVEFISETWPIILFILGILWKQVNTHFDVRTLKKDHTRNEEKTDNIQHEFTIALKAHIIENKNSNEKLTEAITELIKATTILAVKIENIEKK